MQFIRSKEDTVSQSAKPPTQLRKPTAAGEIAIDAVSVAGQDPAGLESANLFRADGEAEPGALLRIGQGL